MRVRFPGALGMGEGEYVLPDAVTADSRKVVRGGVFVAVPGTRCDGSRFIPDAVAAGVSVIIGRERPSDLPETVRFFPSPDPARAYAYLVREREGRPDEKLSLFGVTGTNGKTTTAWLWEHLLRETGVPCGLLSTIEFRDGKVTCPATHTTPDPDSLFGALLRMAENGCRAAALELSSHALDQGRACGARFRAAVFTNCTGDHLDYHGDMEHYYLAKKRLFTELLAPEGIAVLNGDDPWCRRLAAEIGARKLTFGVSQDVMVRLAMEEGTADGTRFTLKGSGVDFSCFLPLIGAHNVCNAAGVILSLLDFGIPADRIAEVLAKPFAIPGRLEHVVSPRGAHFFVDFAHTDDALVRVLSALRALKPKRLWAVFGAGGDRDTTKRPRMGRAAAEHADKLLVTSDNPRSEEPLEIIRAIVSGIPEGTDCTVEPDRAKALRFAAEHAGEGEIVLVAGKGHENYQEIKGVKYPFGDRACLEEFFSR